MAGDSVLLAAVSVLSAFQQSKRCGGRERGREREMESASERACVRACACARVWQAEGGRSGFGVSFLLAGGLMCSEEHRLLRAISASFLGDRQRCGLFQGSSLPTWTV